MVQNFRFLGLRGLNAWLLACTCLLSLLLVLLPAEGQAKRLALVIGNSDYQYDSVLLNPKNDARDIAAALERLGFEVMLGIDMDKNALEYAVRDFADRLLGVEAALVFYAGHGLQVDGKNYLIPVDANIEAKSDVWLQSVDLDIIFRVIEGPNRVNLIFLDACRNNRFARSINTGVGAGRSGSEPGLAQVRTAIGSLVTFATEPGNYALDGDGRNSPFTEALLRHIETPDLEVRSLLSRVRQDVVDATNGKQVPWDHSSLVGSFYFKPELEDEVAAKKADEPSPARNETAQIDLEISYWNSIKDSSDARDFEDYLARWPAGHFSGIAKRRLETLSTTQPEPTRLSVVKPEKTEPPKAAPKPVEEKKPNPPRVALAGRGLRLPDIGTTFTYACDTGTETHRIINKDSNGLEVVVDHDDNRFFASDTQQQFRLDATFPYIGVPLEWRDLAKGQNTTYDYPGNMRAALAQVSQNIQDFSAEYAINNNAFPATIRVTVDAGRASQQPSFAVKTIYTISDSGRQQTSEITYGLDIGWYRSYSYHVVTENKQRQCTLVE